MNEWIEINLPWAEPYSEQPLPDYLEYPSLDEEAKEQFGYSESSLLEEAFGEEKENWVVSKTYDAFYKAQRKIEEEGIYDRRELDKRLAASKDKSVQKVLSFFAKLDPLRKWMNEHPKTKEIEAKNKVIAKEFSDKQRAEAKGFTGRGLNKAGVLMELEENGKLSQMLIGEINELGGSCDDCCGIQGDTVVKRYKVIWEREMG
jgi:hypothetical protein